jgi:hypothetical protein
MAAQSKAFLKVIEDLQCGQFRPSTDITKQTGIKFPKCPRNKSLVAVKGDHILELATYQGWILSANPSQILIDPRWTKASNLSAVLS